MRWKGFLVFPFYSECPSSGSWNREQELKIYFTSFSFWWRWLHLEYLPVKPDDDSDGNRLLGRLGMVSPSSVSRLRLGSRIRQTDRRQFHRFHRRPIQIDRDRLRSSRLPKSVEIGWLRNGRLAFPFLPRRKNGIDSILVLRKRGEEYHHSGTNGKSINQINVIFNKKDPPNDLRAYYIRVISLDSA